MSNDQLNTQIESIKQQLVNKYQAEKIILFGSAVSGKMTKDSDLDFLIVKDDIRTFHERVSEVYRLVKKEMAADFIVVTPEELNKRLQLGDPFFKSILSKGRVLYG